MLCSVSAHVVQVASFAIVLNQARTLWEECFVSKCAHCRGAGTVICPRCAGTKTLRRRPAQLRIKDLDLLDAPGDTCGSAVISAVCLLPGRLE